MSTIRLAQAAGIVGVTMLLSRILGFLRNSIIAAQFGQTRLVDMYNAAYFLPDALYLILIGGAVSSAFIPVLAGYLARGQREEVWEVSSIAFNLVLVVMSAVVLVGLVAAPLLVHLLTPGFDPDEAAFTAFLVRVMLVAMLFNSLNGVLYGVEYAHNYFWATGIGPLFYNLAIIGLGLGLAGVLGIIGFAYGVLAGSFLNFLVQLWGIRHLHPRFKWSLNWRHPGVRRVGTLMIPIVLSAAVWQVNLLVNQPLLGSFLARGSINALSISSRIMLLPVSFATSLAIPLLPALSGHLARDDRQRFRGHISSSLGAVIFVALPASVGLVVLARPIISLLFQHGQFTPHATYVTSQALLFYAVGILAYSCLEILYRAFYALQDTVTPLKIGIWYVAVGMVLNLVLVRYLNYRGLALAYSLAGFFNLALVWMALRRRLGPVGGRNLASNAARTLVAAALMGVVVAGFRTWLETLPWPAGLAGQALEVVLEIGLGAASFTLYAWLLRTPELVLVFSRLRRS
ncbi:MAG: murein biosynthesis integral membrane protein MurJ [Thermaerobacter sp.]|nr:murein biosynthesis integral membrane protein MurJ [Thermaerobacter sp.]